MVLAHPQPLPEDFSGSNTYECLWCTEPSHVFLLACQLIFILRNKSHPLQFAGVFDVLHPLKQSVHLCSVPFVVASRSVRAGRLGKLEVPSQCVAPSGNCTVMRGLCSHSPLGFLMYLQIDKIVCYLPSPNIPLHLIAAFFTNCCHRCPRLLMR